MSCVSLSRDLIRGTVLVAAAGVLAGVAVAPRPAAAQLGIGLRGVSLSPNVILPTGEMGDRWKIGFGGGLAGEHRFRDGWALAGEFGYIRFIGRTLNEPGQDRERDLDAWQFGAGLRRTLGEGPLFAGLDVGYYVFTLNAPGGVDDQFGLLPVLGFRAQAFSLTGRYKATGDAAWFEVRLNLRGLR